jgi:hypothetical protein
VADGSSRDCFTWLEPFVLSRISEIWDGKQGSGAYIFQLLRPNFPQILQIASPYIIDGLEHEERFDNT